MTGIRPPIVDPLVLWQATFHSEVRCAARHDTKDTIARAVSMGIEVKMVTGDAKEIAKETCRTLGMGTNILGAEVFEGASAASATSISDIVIDSHGFAEVFPEHKFRIVEILMDKGFTVGMTGDGVNDAPALRKSHIGIAVQGATDAARAAADIVLTDPGLSVIVYAVLTARKIFARVRNYCIYRVACTLQLVFFFFVAVLAFEPAASFPPSQREYSSTKTFFDPNPTRQEYERVFFLPVLTLVLLTILNDGCIISICRDKVVPANRPQHWNLSEIFAVAASLGAWLVAINIGMLAIGFSLGPGAIAGGRPCGQNPAFPEFAGGNSEMVRPIDIAVDTSF
jgi:H+-transporting ATPase